MSLYYNYTYVSVAERRRKAERKVKKLQKKGRLVEPVIIEGRRIATTFWGKAWCDNMESYRDFENRLPRGRTYVRNGSVIDLQISPKEIKALVSGSEIYEVTINITEISKNKWQSICADCTGSIDSLVELLQGKFSQGVMERLCHQESGLFPRPSEIHFACSCPDYASMCKHVAAVLYGIGARFDRKPELLFHLRAVNEADLLARIDPTLPVSKTKMASDQVLQTDDVSALFGIDMAVSQTIEQPKRKKSSRSPRTATAKIRKPAKKTTVAKKRLPKKQASRKKTN